MYQQDGRPSNVIEPPGDLQQSSHVPKLPETPLSIVLSSLESKLNPNAVNDLKDITIRLFETHRVRADRSGIYNAEAAPYFPNIEEIHGRDHTGKRTRR